MLVSENEEIFVIDFPQMVSVNHLNAEELFHKDLVCLNEFFSNKFLVESEELPQLKDICVLRNLDLEIKASGYIRTNLKQKEINDLDKIYEIANEGDNEENVKEDDQQPDKEIEDKENDDEEADEEADEEDDEEDDDDEEEKNIDTNFIEQNEDKSIDVKN